MAAHSQRESWTDEEVLAGPMISETHTSFSIRHFTQPDDERRPTSTSRYMRDEKVYSVFE